METKNIILRKFNSIDNCIMCHLNNDINNIKLNFCEVYNNGYNTNYFNVYNDNSFGGFDNSVCNTKFNYINDNIEFFSFLNMITENYNKLNKLYIHANWYILEGRKETNEFINIMDNISDVYYIIDSNMETVKKFHVSKQKKIKELLKQLKAILQEIKENKYT